jgi:plastocyanin
MPRQRWAALIGFGCVPLLVFAWVALGWATETHVVMISARGIAPPRLAVRVGERVRWVSGGQQLRLEFDPHENEHEVVTRAGEIQAIFLVPGEHWYEGAVGRNGETTTFQGTVVVREATRSRDALPVCSEDSSYRICFAP